jgi:glucokinase
MDETANTTESADTTPTVIAIDVGGSSTKSAVVSRDLQLIRPVTTTPLDSTGTSADIFGTLADVINRHLHESDHIQGISFGFPGPCDYEKGICLIQHTDKFQSLYGYHIPTALEPLLGQSGLPMRFQNDAQAAIIGEVIYGVGKDYQRVIGLTLGTGLGSAFMADGKLVTSGQGVPEDGWLYPLPYKDSIVDDSFSTRGLVERFRQNGVEAEDVESAMQQLELQSAGIQAAFASFGRDFGEFLQPIVAEFQADAIVMLGGIANASDYFVPAMQQSLTIPLLRGDLGSRAPLLGLTDLFFNDPLYQTASAQRSPD